MVLATCAAIVLATCARTPRPFHGKAIELQAAGARSLGQGELDRAAGQFSLALEYEPRMAAAENGLGLVALRRGDQPLARDHFEAALAIDDDLAEAHLNLGSIFLARDELDDALAHFQQALAIDPGFGAARLAHAEVLLRLGRLEEARWQLAKLCESQPRSAGAHAAHALVLARLGRIAAAEAAARRAQALDGALPAIQRARAEILRRGGDLSGAIEALRALLRAQPLGIDDRLSLATTLALAGRAEEAAGELEGLEASAPRRAEVPFVRAFVALRRERIEEAVAAARRALALRARYPEARLVLAEALLRSGRTGEGKRELGRFIAEAPAHLEAERQIAARYLGCQGAGDTLGSDCHYPDEGGTGK
jgi:tetratricopeptide (TPR) repeat protein